MKPKQKYKKILLGNGDEDFGVGRRNFYSTIVTKRMKSQFVAW